jgi:hypothetical protein
VRIPDEFGYMILDADGRLLYYAGTLEKTRRRLEAFRARGDTAIIYHRPDAEGIFKPLAKEC